MGIFAQIIGFFASCIRPSTTSNSANDEDNIMATLKDIGVDFVEEFLSNGNHTVHDLSDFLKERFLDARGFSTRTIERFCHEHGIKRKGTVSDAVLDVLVERAVHQVLIIDI